MYGIGLAELWKDDGPDSRDRRMQAPKSKKRNKSSADMRTFLLLRTKDAVFLYSYKREFLQVSKLHFEFDIRVLHPSGERTAG